jgi:hypothetical protein
VFGIRTASKRFKASNIIKGINEEHSMFKADLKTSEGDEIGTHKIIEISNWYHLVDIPLLTWHIFSMTWRTILLLFYLL